MKVFKFGGASVGSAERMRNVARILEQYKNDKLFVVVSAMGKTTNALEKVVEAFFNGNQQEALQYFADITSSHEKLALELLGQPLAALNDFFTEIEWLLHDKPVRAFDYYYDQVVCVGELLSSRILSAFLQNLGIANSWIDVRDTMRTDNNFRDARIDWSFTAERSRDQILPLFQETDIVITQGFIGSTDENESTTLGREGSDYSAAVFANLLDAESQTIWKDVKGVMNADPKQYEKAEWINELNYREVIEMAYYGAQVIHPKTIKPLQNKEIPLYVKSFLNPEDEGTIIHSGKLKQLPPIIVYKHQQVLVELSSKDFSFVGEGLTAELYRIFERIKFKPNLTQNAAISLLCVVDDHKEKVEQLASYAATSFDVNVTKGLRLLTIRHYNNELLQELCKDCEVMLRQQTMETIQILLKDK
jgi:aspartate kinase